MPLVGRSTVGDQKQPRAEIVQTVQLVKLLAILEELDTTQYRLPWVYLPSLPMRVGELLGRGERRSHLNMSAERNDGHFHTLRCLTVC